MVHYIPLIIPFGVKKLWDQWNIRGAILFSLSLQTMLMLVAPIRKSARKKMVILLIWLAYLLADAAANFTIGLISNSQRNQSNKSVSKPMESSDLLAFWAPFLLLHLGGPDTITAFSLEDNQLWLRHLLGLGFQAAAIIYVFIQSFPNKNLWIPTMLIFASGIIKYVERTRALFLASLDKFRDSMLKEPDPAINYGKLMRTYGFKKKANLPVRIEIKPEADIDISVTDILVLDRERPLSHLEVVQCAYSFFQKFKGLVVDLIFSFRERNDIRDFFNKTTAEDALRIIEVELDFLYGTLYTKVEAVRSIAGHILRFIAFGSVLAALGIFYFQAKKDEFHKVDIKITYTLLLGAVVLDVIAFLMLIFSDRTFASVKNPRPHSWPMVAVFNSFLALKNPRWQPCKCPMGHNVLATPIAFRRWSGSISGHNLIRYCLKSNSTRIHEFPSLWQITFEKILCSLRINGVAENVGANMKNRKTSQFNTCIAKCNGSRRSIIDKITRFLRSIEENVIQNFSSFFRLISIPVKDFVDVMMYVSPEPLTKELWEFIFLEIQSKSAVEVTPETAMWRGDWVLKNGHSMVLRKYVSYTEYDESVLLWHIATDLCYYTEDEEIQDKERSKHQHFSKILSDYMLYLLVFRPTMMSAVAGIGKRRFRDTCAEAERFFRSHSLRPNQEDACKIILARIDVEPAMMKGKGRKSVLCIASKLAKELKEMETVEKWKLISGVWVELMSRAATHCAPITHAQQLSQGGELFTFVWLLMAHFGMGERFQIRGLGRARLIVGK